MRPARLLVVEPEGQAGVVHHVIGDGVPTRCPINIPEAGKLISFLSSIYNVSLSEFDEEFYWFGGLPRIS